MSLIMMGAETFVHLPQSAVLACAAHHAMVLSSLPTAMLMTAVLQIYSYVVKARIRLNSNTTLAPAVVLGYTHIV